MSADYTILQVLFGLAEMWREDYADPTRTRRKRFRLVDVADLFPARRSGASNLMQAPYPYDADLAVRDGCLWW